MIYLKTDLIYPHNLCTSLLYYPYGRHKRYFADDTLFFALAAYALHQLFYFHPAVSFALCPAAGQHCPLTPPALLY